MTNKAAAISYLHNRLTGWLAGFATYTHNVNNAIIRTYIHKTQHIFSFIHRQTVRFGVVNVLRLCVCMRCSHTIMPIVCIIVGKIYNFHIHFLAEQKKKIWHTYEYIYSYRTMRAKKEYRRRKWHVTHAHDTRAIAERDYQLLVCAEWVDSVAVRSNIECHIAFDCCAYTYTSLHIAVYSFSCNKRHGKQYNSDAAQKKVGVLNLDGVMCVCRATRFQQVTHWCQLVNFAGAGTNWCSSSVERWTALLQQPEAHKFYKLSLSSKRKMI